MLKIKKNKNGLPLEVKFCKLCNLSNQNPTSINEYFHTRDTVQKTVEFDENNICSACKFNKAKWDDTINWKEREKELIDLCNRHRKTDGSYDCIIGGSGGKDSVFQSYTLKYKYKMNPLTVTWAPHLYTDIGWKNFQNWLHKGGFDNYLFNPNGRVLRKLTQEATKNLLHPFQPFIIGQKTYVVKMADRFNIPLIFYGESPGEGGKKISITEKGFTSVDQKNSSQKGFELNPLAETSFENAYLGGKQVKEFYSEGLNKNDLKAYEPLDPEIIKKKKINFYFLGYFLRWVPQENFYFASKHVDFQTNDFRTEGTYQKYASIDDKTDGFFYYTRYIKFGVGRAMIDSCSEIRNGHINKDEGKRLIEKYDGEYPSRFEKEFLDYIAMSKEEFENLCDEFRPDHIWEKKSNRWKLKND
tara:strand:- start:3862 stop:5103 length:1242 start_codon:yes stop_codon:yes gene_type:complete